VKRVWIKRQTITGPVVAEMRAYSAALGLCSVTMLVITATHNVDGMIGGTVIGGAVAASLGWRPRRSLPGKSTLNAQDIPSMIEVEKPSRTIFRTLCRGLVLYAPLSVTVFVLSVGGEKMPYIGDGVIAGIWLVGSLDYLAKSEILRRWECSNHRILLRDMRRWFWFELSMDADNETPDNKMLRYQGLGKRFAACFYTMPSADAP